MIEYVFIDKRIQRKQQPAPSDIATPSGLTTIPSLFKNNSAQPIIASTVAISHTRVGRRFNNNHSIIPEKTGALPIVTTVPIATPVNLTEEKNKYWKTAIEMAA